MALSFLHATTTETSTDGNGRKKAPWTKSTLVYELFVVVVDDDNTRSFAAVSLRNNIAGNNDNNKVPIARSQEAGASLIAVLSSGIDHKRIFSPPLRRWRFRCSE